MNDVRELSLDVLKGAVSGGAAALRCVVDLQPAGGPGDKVFPPTYEGGAYAKEQRRIDGREVQCVVLDSVASQANRIELALLRAYRRKQITLPMIEVDFTGEPDLRDIGTISVLEAPHRIADAILRDAKLTDTPFRQTEVGRSFTNASVKDASVLYQWCPTALVLGMWDSTGPKGGAGTKFARCLVSEIVGYDAVTGIKSASRIDPLQIQRNAGLLYETTDGRWTLDETLAKMDGKKPIKLGKDGKPSEAVHGNVTPTLTEGAGGVTISRARLTTTISLPGLRRLHFPDKEGLNNEARNDAGRTVLAALGLCGAVLAHAEGLDLRSRCLLVPTAVVEWEVLGEPGLAPKRYRLSADGARELLGSAAREAEALKLSFAKAPLILKPIPDLVTLVRKSRELASSGQGAE